jgi:iron complex outermembrane receptor protein
VKPHPFILHTSCAALLSASLPPVSHAAPPSEPLTEIVVTATREGELLKETPASIGSLKSSAIRFAGATHPQQLLGQIPGVAISVTNGEGHQTAIRQPFTTSPLYLFLEDGIPVRPTGFFNHNALYEVNLPMAGGVEVVRGPGSALYGSDAIGGVINVLSQAPGNSREMTLNTEAGSYGWLREMASFSSGNTRFGRVRGDLNLTHTDGWRSATGYDRQSGNFRWDVEVDADTRLQTIFSYTHIDQQTGANSALPFDLYRNAPQTNLFPIAYRKVTALRLSSAFERSFGDGLLSLTPYFRKNSMDLNGSFNLNNDPRIEKTESRSFGLLAKWRQDFPEFFRARLILGLDLEHSPGSRSEDALTPARSDVRGLPFVGGGAGATGAYTQYTAYTVGSRIYDYDVTFRSVSPYLHSEISPVEKLRLTGGLRFDSLGYELENHLGSSPTSHGSTKYGQAVSTTKNFQRLSPKLGFTYEITPKNSLYGSYNQGFRVPSESQLFRGGSNASAAVAQSRAANALLLEPIKADQLELGLRGTQSGIDYSLAVYALRKRNDLVSQRDPLTNAAITQNAGKTLSRGVEVSLGRTLVRTLKIETSLSCARHEYTQWKGKDSSGNAFDYSGNEMSAAPKLLANTRLTWTPSPALTTQLEWVRIGGYFLQDSNGPTTRGTDTGITRYDGYHLLNLRGSYQLCKNASVFGRVLNLANTRYADSASVSSNTAVYSPGLPRTYFAGFEVSF